MNLWLVVLLAGLVTYLTRLSFILLLEKFEMPAWFRRALRFVPPAVLTAIFVPELFRPAGHLDLSFQNTQLLACLVAILVAWRTRNVLLTIAAGALTMLILQISLPLFF